MDADTLRLEIVEQETGEGTKVHVSAGLAAGGGDLLTGLALLGEERGPRTDGFRVVAEFHAREQRLVLQCLVALAQVGHVGLTPHKRHVRGRVDELLRLGQHARLYEVRPQLATDLELFVDTDGLIGGDGAIWRLWRVIEFTEGGVTGSRVVPRIRALLGDLTESLVDLDAPVGLQLLDQRAKGGTHDAATNEDDVDWGLRTHAFQSNAASGCLVATPTDPE